MAGTVILTGANSSLGIPAVEHLLTTYPDFTSILTVRVDSESDPNTARLHATVSRFPNAKTTIVALDLSNLRAVHAFADEISSGISSGQYPPLAAVIANAYYWNLVGDPELTSDGFDKTIQISYISHAALVLRLIGNFGAQGRVILLSSDAHYPGKNPMEKYPPTLPNDLASLVGPTADPDKQGRGFQRYATAKLAMTTWMYSLNDHLQQDASLSKICALAVDPGNLVDSRALTSNTPASMHRMQKYLLKPLLPVLRIGLGTKLRTSRPAGIDVIELSLSPKFANKRGYYIMLKEDKSSPESNDKATQSKLWKKTLEWAHITPQNTNLSGAFE